jgi:hypothetical protein
MNQHARRVGMMDCLPPICVLLDPTMSSDIHRLPEQTWLCADYGL